MQKQFKYILILVILAFAPQPAILAGNATGYYITRNNDTVYTIFRIPIGWFSGAINYISLQRKVKYFDGTGKELVLRPADAKQIYFEYNGLRHTYLSCENNFSMHPSWSDSGGYIFLRLLIDGPLRLFIYYKKQYSGGYFGSSGYFHTVGKDVLQKNGREMLQPTELFFKKEISAYMSDYPELAQKILDKEFRQNDIKEIVEEYNRWAGNRPRTELNTSPRPSPQGEGDAPK